MPITGTKAVVAETLKSKSRFGLYSLPLWEGMSPFMKKIIFGNETFGQSKSTKVSVKDIVLSPTTSEDGKSVVWRTLGVKRPETTVDGAVTASSSITLIDAKGFSVGDYVVFREPTGDVTGYITAVNANNITLDTAVTLSDTTVAVRISYSKGKSAVIDRLDYELEYETFSNYFQDFGAKKSFDLDLINSNIDIDLGAEDWNKSPRELLKSQNVMTSVKNYLKLEFSRKVGMEVLGDVEMAFIAGKKNSQSIGGSVRQYTMGLEEIAENVSISTTETDLDAANQDKFNQISETIYDVMNTAFQYNNQNVEVICNNAFYKEFMKLMAGKVSYTEDVESAGNQLKKIKFVDGRTIELAYMPVMDKRYGTTPTAYAIPMDLIGAYNPGYSDVDASNSAFDLQDNKGDVLIKKNISDQDTLDTFSFSLYYRLGFIFGGAESGAYKRITIE